MHRWKLIPIVALALLSGTAPAGQSEPQREPSRAGRTYDAAAIYALSYQGVHLGMEYAEACRLLLANGYTRRTVAEHLNACAVEGWEDGGGATFFGQRVTQGLPALPAGAPAAHVRFFSLTTRIVRGRRLVTRIEIHTDEPNRRAELAAEMRAAWGEPTLDTDWGYNMLAYGASQRQADSGNRQHFSSCRAFPQCRGSAPPHGNCGTVLQEFTTVHAEAVIYNWGRWLRIEDERDDPEVARILSRREWIRPEECLFTVH